MTELLDKPRLAIHDSVMAEFLSLGSAISELTHEGKNFVGKADLASYKALRWRHLALPVGRVGGQWASYEGFRGSGVTPNKYGAAAIILVDRESMDAALRKHSADHAQQAVAYRLGSAVMVGTSTDHKLLGLEHEDDADYKVAMRIGKGPLDAQVAIETHYYGSKRLFLPLDKGVRSGPIIAIPEVPPSVPLV